MLDAESFSFMVASFRLFGSRIVWFKAALVLALIALSGCGDSPLGSGDENVLRLGNGSEPRDLDPHTVTGVPEVNILNGLFEGLVGYHPTDDAQVLPGMATHWEMSDDGRIWTFHLRAGARWSNGDPVTAGDFVYSWRRVIEPGLGCEYADWMYMVEGAEAYHTGQTDDIATVGLAAPDPQTFVVTLADPVADFLLVILNHTFLPVHPPTIEAFEAFDNRATGWTRSDDYVSNGPFQLALWQPDQKIKIERNAFYWDAENVGLDAVIFLPVSDQPTEQRMFFGGLMDKTSSVPVNRRASLRAEQPEVIRFDPYAGIYMYRLNITDPTLADVRVRRALSLAVDRQLLIDEVLQGGERPALAYTPDGIGGYRPPLVIESDMEAARALLAEAGFPGGEGFPQLEILFNSSDIHRTMAEAIQQMWKDALGIDVILVNQEWQVYLNSMRSLDYQVCRAGWIGSVYPFSFLRNYYSDSPNNATGFADPVYDQLLDQARIELDRSRQHEILREAEGRLLEAMPVIPLFWYSNVYLIRLEVEGWHPKWVDQRPLQHVRMAVAP